MPNDYNGLLYFSHQNCGVCKVLRPKVEQMIGEYFPQLEFSYVDIEKESGGSCRASGVHGSGYSSLF
jgi:thiol-disulfide isomerase/thioredoxin